MKNFKILSVLLVVILVFGNKIFAQNDLFGTYYYQDSIAVPLADVNVELYDLNDLLIATTVTNSDGEYTFTGIPSGEFYISSSTSITSGGVDLYDAWLVFFYIRGWIDFNEMEFEVADVNDNGHVNNQDFVAILINYLVGGQPFVGGEWEFEDMYVDFTSRDRTDTIDLWGSSHGDVEGIWEPSGRDIDLLRSSYYESWKQEETSKLVVASDYNGYVNGFNLNLAYATDEISIVNISGPDGNFGYSVDEESGVIKVAWINESQGTSEIDGDQLFIIEVEGLTEESSAEKVLFLLPGGMIIDSENNKLDDTEIKLPLLASKQTTDLVEVTAYPNPVVNKLNFNIQLNKQSYASLSVYDLSGKLVNFIEYIALHEGEQVVSFNAEDLLPGNYIYSFDLKGENVMNIKGRFVKSN